MSSRSRGRIVTRGNILGNLDRNHSVSYPYWKTFASFGIYLEQGIILPWIVMLLVSSLDQRFAEKNPLTLYVIFL